MASEFPMIPGYVPSYPLENQDYKKRSALQQEKNRKAGTESGPRYPTPKSTLVPKTLVPSQHSLNYETTTLSTFQPLEKADVQEQFQPNYVHFDRQVCRFYAYFKESVPESNLENFRVRNLIIKLHLEDNAIEILEIKQENSGVPQGNFLARKNVLRNDGSGHFLDAYDFEIGQSTEIHGKSVFVFDCDGFTREFYESIKKPQPPGQDLLRDNFTKYVTPKFHNKEWNGLNSSVLNGRVPCMKQFLNLDRNVLRYYVHSGIPYIMHYFLADDTMEVREINYANSGKDPFPLLLRRQRFPKSYSLNQPGLSTLDSFVRESEISHGMVLKVFGRDFKVNGCDEHTQEFYKKRYGVDFPLGDGLDHSRAQDTGMMIPPYNGFGDEEDSLGNVYRLVPLPPKKDFFKWVDNQIQLKMTAKLNTKNPEDVDRRFIITFYLNDDTVMVYEPQQRNSGIVSGKFLEKCKYKNTKRNLQFFEPADFIIGNDVVVNSYDFHVTGCDVRTRNWYKDYFQVEMPENST